MKPADHEEHTLQRINSTSCNRSRSNSSKILPSNSSSQLEKYEKNSTNINNKPKQITTMVRSFLNIVTLQTLLHTCRWLKTPSSTLLRRRTVTGTLFGHKKGYISFAVQDDPRSDPVFLIELAITTSSLVKEMSSGLVRIALESSSSSCKGGGGGGVMKLFQEPMWSMYCNGRKCGYAMSRVCGEDDWRLLSTVQTISVGAGVVPSPVPAGMERRLGEGGGGDVMYMRSRFERVVGNRDSEAFYMMNPDGSGGPELSMFLLRI